MGTHVRWIAAALLFGLGGGSLGAQQFGESVVPLQDPQVNQWYVLGDVVLAIDFRGLVRKTAYVNAYSLTSKTFLWRLEVQVEHSREATGQYTRALFEHNLVLLGNGPLSLLDVSTGRIRWTLDCGALGSVDLESAVVLPGGSLLIGGPKGCGADEDRRVHLIDLQTGTVRWSAEYKSLKYKNGNTEYVKSQWIAQRNASGEVERVVLVGDRLSAVNYADGRPAWSAKEGAGRVADLRGDLIVFARDDKLIAHRLTDGSVAWTLKIDAPWAQVMDVPDSKDVFYFTYHGAFRVDPITGAQRWSARRSKDSWTRVPNPPLVFMRTDDVRWGAYDIATGAKRWDFRRDWGEMGAPEHRIGIPATGTVVFYAADKYDNDRDVEVPPFVLWGVDAATGAVRWKLAMVNGNRLEGFEPVTDQTLVVQEEKTGTVSLVNVADGAVKPLGEVGTGIATASAACTVRYFRSDKTLACVGGNGARVWTRAGPQSENRDLVFSPERGWVLWSAKDGTVELIRISDGASLYKTVADRNPKPLMAGGYLLVPSGRTLKIVTLE